MTVLKKFIRAYQESEVIFEEGSRGDEMFLVHRGKVKLSSKAPSGQFVWGTVGKGEFFSEVALVDASPRAVTATAEEDDTELVVLDRDKFMYLVQQQPIFSLMIMRALSQTVRELWTQCTTLREGASHGGQ